MTRNEFLARLALAAVLTPVIHVIDQWGGSPLHGGTAWLIAAVAAVLLVFVGEFLIDAFRADDI